MDFYTLDVFTDAAYSGNPLAVVLGADDLTDGQMQRIAREFNLSETIFVQKPDDAKNTAKVRIFHPAGELPFAGHPTIGCAILLTEMAHTRDFSANITLEEVAGLVPVDVLRSDGVISAEFTAPVIPHAFDAGKVTAEMAAAALGLSVTDIGFGGHMPNNLQGGPSFVYVPVNSREALTKARVCSPDWQTLTTATNNESVYVYCRADNGYAARMFAPGHGMSEDPATGSASAIFAAQLLAAGDLSEGTTKINLSQGEDMGRPSQIKLSIDVAAGAIIAVRVKGSAVRLSHGELINLPLES